MPRRTIDPEIRARVVNRKLSGESTATIAIDEGIDPKTVRNWLRDADAPTRIPERIDTSAIGDDSDDKLSLREWIGVWIGVLAFCVAFIGLIIATARSQSLENGDDLKPDSPEQPKVSGVWHRGTLPLTDEDERYIRAAT